MHCLFLCHHAYIILTHIHTNLLTLHYFLIEILSRFTYGPQWLAPNEKRWLNRVGFVSSRVGIYMKRRKRGCSRAWSLLSSSIWSSLSLPPHIAAHFLSLHQHAVLGECQGRAVGYWCGEEPCVWAEELSFIQWQGTERGRLWRPTLCVSYVWWQCVHMWL